MKKILRSASALLCAVLLLCAAGCSKYGPVDSSEAELRTVLTLDGGRYEVPYELYRFAFLQEKKEVVTGTTDGWTDLVHLQVFQRINRVAVDEIARTYAFLSLCEKYGIDPYDGEIDDIVQAAVTEAIEGTESVAGYGTHEAYLAALKDEYMNDSVFRLYLRIAECEKRLGAKLRDDGVIQTDRETVLRYLMSEDCVRATWIYIPYTALGNYTDDMLKALTLRAQTASEERFLEMTHEVLPDAYTDEELDIGFYIGKYQLDLYYETLTETVFSLKEGQTSGLIHSGDGVYIVRRLPKDLVYLNDEKNQADFAEYYLLNTYDRMVNEEKERLKTTVSYAPLHGDLTVETVDMK